MGLGATDSSQHDRATRPTVVIIPSIMAGFGQGRGMVAAAVFHRRMAGKYWVDAGHENARSFQSEWAWGLQIRLTRPGVEANNQIVASDCGAIGLRPRQ